MSACKPLKVKGMPSSYESSYEPVPTLQKQRNKLEETADERCVIETPDTPFFLSRVGQLRMEFAEEGSLTPRSQAATKEQGNYVGTASVFAVTSDTVYAITCAHNLSCFNPMEGVKSCESAWFVRRQTTKDGSSSVPQATYQISGYWVHDQYVPSDAISQYDLAVLKFNDKDKYFENLEGLRGLDPIIEEKPDLMHIYGYPGDKKGQLWGQSKKARVNVKKESSLLQYDIQTTGGQSGSPIIKVTKDPAVTKLWIALTTTVFVFAMFVAYVCGCHAGLSFDISVVAVVLTMYGLSTAKPTALQGNKCTIVGIHTTGCATGNFGVKLTNDSMRWIKKCVTADDAGNNEGADDDDCYCFKEETFETPYM